MPYCEGIFAEKAYRNLLKPNTFPMLDGEDKLITSAVKGNSSAFGQLYDHYQPMIYRFVAVKVSRREEAEDITHQVFLSAWQNIKSYEHRGHPFSSWLYQVARNQVIDHYRAKRINTDIEAIDPEYFAAPASVEFTLPMKLQMETVREAMQKLKQDYQDIIIMRFVEEISIKEAAVALNKTEGAIKLMQHRAIRELKKLLKDESL
jgi:RNA polymerase sigma-70 factor (ECF subfamily)